MKLNLERNLIVFDIESTGLSVKNDRILQLAIIKLHADNSEPIERKRLINPTIPISAEASAVHGITDEMVRNEPTFAQLSKNLYNLIDDSDFCTFNGNRFDIPMLMEEFARCGIELDMTNRKCVDVKRIFHRMERRDLKAAYQFYCGKTLEGAHDAMNDVRATLGVLQCMLDRYNGQDCIDKDDNVIPTPIVNDMQALSDFTKDFDNVDFAGTVKLNKDGIAVFGFGKYQGQSVVECLSRDKSYYDWIMTKGEFTTETRRIISSMMDAYRKTFLLKE